MGNPAQYKGSLYSARFHCISKLAYLHVNRVPFLYRGEKPFCFDKKKGTVSTAGNNGIC